MVGISEVIAGAAARDVSVVVFLPSWVRTSAKSRAHIHLLVDDKDKELTTYNFPSLRLCFMYIVAHEQPSQVCSTLKFASYLARENSW